jgi:hypothetical protein
VKVNVAELDACDDPFAGPPLIVAVGASETEGTPVPVVVPTLEPPKPASTLVPPAPLEALVAPPFEAPLALVGFRVSTRPRSRRSRTVRPRAIVRRGAICPPLLTASTPWLRRRFIGVAPIDRVGYPMSRMRTTLEGLLIR